MAMACLQGNLPLEEVFEQLSTSRCGLSSADAAERLQLFGANRLEEKRVNPPFLLLILFFFVCGRFTSSEFLIFASDRRTRFSSSSASCGTLYPG